jgi:hypothetical protein
MMPGRSENDNILLDGDEILAVARDCVQHNLVGERQLIAALQLIAELSNYGVSPKDVAISVARDRAIISEMAKFND